MISSIGTQEANTKPTRCPGVGKSVRVVVARTNRLRFSLCYLLLIIREDLSTQDSTELYRQSLFNKPATCRKLHYVQK